MTFKYKHKKTQTSKTQRKEEKRTRSSRERENPRRSEPLPSFSLPSRRPCPGGALVVPPHCSIWVCLSPAKLQPSFFLNSSPTQAPSPKPPSLTHFGICVCVSAWIAGWVSGFVCISGLCFGRGFGPLSAFQAAFLLVVLNLLVSIWVAHISTLFFGFSDLGFAHISARFFWFFCSFFFFFCSSSLVLDGFWS